MRTSEGVDQKREFPHRESMAHHTRTLLDGSPEAMQALTGQLSTLDDAAALETELQAHHFSQTCLRQFEEEARLERMERQTTEVIEALLIAPAAGAISTLTTKKDFPIGGVVNVVLGAGAKALSVWNPAENPGLRVAGRAGKVFLHSQLSIITRSLIQRTS
jgi:hypothetical protein